jgi:DNA-binding transcriptional ArsR family regulator
MSEDETPEAQADAMLGGAALRALAHPLRIRILDELSAYGPLTATGLAARLGESSGVMSYHLRQLEKHELVREVTDRGTARERWWERRPGGIQTPDARRFAPGTAERLATQLITNEWVRGRQQNFHEFLVEGESAFEPEWIEAAASHTTNVRLTPAQLRALVTAIDAAVQPFVDRYKADPSPGSRPVQIHLNAFPLVRGDRTPTEGVDDRTDRTEQEQ